MGGIKTHSDSAFERRDQLIAFQREDIRKLHKKIEDLESKNGQLQAALDMFANDAEAAAEAVWAWDTKDRT